MSNPIQNILALQTKNAISAEDFIRANAWLGTFSLPIVLLSLVALFWGIMVVGGEEAQSLEAILPLLQDGSLIGPLCLGGLALVGIILITVYAIKFSIMRLHDFNLSGWYLLGIMGAFGVLEWILPLLSAVFMSVLSFYAYFKMPLKPSRWQKQAFSATLPSGFERIIIFIMLVFVWHSILGDPIYALIEIL